MANQSSIKQLEADLWASADVLRANANINASQYCMPVLGLLMANPPFNVNGVREADVSGSPRLPFGFSAVNKEKEVSNANYLWIQYFYAYLNETGRAGFVMASSATDSQSRDKSIRESLVRTGHVDCLISGQIEINA